MATTDRRSEAIWIEKKKYWQVKVQKDGERKAFTSPITGRKGKHEAEGKADDWLSSGLSDKRFKEAWAAFLAYEETKSPDCYEQHKSLGKNWIEKPMQNKRLSSITPMDWQRAIDAAAKANKSKRLCANIRSAGTAFCRHCKRMRWRIEPIDPYEVTIPANTRAKDKVVLQPNDLLTVFSQDSITRYGKPTPFFFIHAIRFTIVVGPRRGELCGLRADERQSQFIPIHRSFNKRNEETKGKNENAQRKLVLSKRAQKILDDQAQMLKEMGIDSPWIFPDENGEQLDPNHLYKVWYTYRNQNNLKSSLHGLRGTFVSAVKADLPDPLLKKVLGHSAKTDTIGIYGSEIDGDLERTADIIDAVFDKLIGETDNKVGGKVGGKPIEKAPEPQ